MNPMVELCGVRVRDLDCKRETTIILPRSVLQTQADPQVQTRDMVVEVEHARPGPVKTLGLPVEFSDMPGKVATGARSTASTLARSCTSTASATPRSPRS
jgi:hypothetical protein